MSRFSMLISLVLLAACGEQTGDTAIAEGDDYTRTAAITTYEIPAGGSVVIEADGLYQVRRIAGDYETDATGDYWVAGGCLAPMGSDVCGVVGPAVVFVVHQR